ncbi:MAG: GlxA family transcriptional regulator [Alphaproteobacteria bacterium]|nr:GlxA family transcriptional regulator [Alphaproteobacteria bacterium]
MANSNKNPKPRRVGVLPLPGFALMSYACVVEPLRAANLLGEKTLYEIVNISTDTSAPRSSGAALITAQAHIGDTLHLDDLFVIAGGHPETFADKNVLGWIAQMARKVTLLGGVSAGPVILAKAGVMAGRRMTVHWEHAAALAEISPDLAIEHSLYVIDRDRVTCAGGTAPLDLMHALIAAQHSTAFARKVSDWFMHTEIRPAGGQQRAGLVERVDTTNPAILDAVEVMENHVADVLTLPQLAHISGVSPRQLNRLFTEKLGLPTIRYYRVLRLVRAQNLLRNSSMQITEIALATGFASSAHFSSAYARHFQVAPSLDRLRSKSLI